MGGKSHCKGGQSGLPTHDRRRVPRPTDPRRDRFPPSLDCPRTILEPTLVQLYPHHWYAGDSPCYYILGNWLDGTTDWFMTEYNVQLVIHAAGTNPNKGRKPPLDGYGINAHTGVQPLVIDCPINHRTSVCREWKTICDMSIFAWGNARHGERGREGEEG